MKDGLTHIAYGQRIADLKQQTKKRPALYYNVVDALDNTLLSHNSPSYCKWWQQKHGLVGKTQIRSVR